MDTDERELFKAERVRLHRTQKDVQDKSGIGQGLISRIEIDPTYNPTVAVFKRAVGGIDLTLSSFYARIEGLRTAEPGTDNVSPFPADLRTVSDEAPLVPSTRDSDEAIATLAHLLALAREGRDGLHRRQATNLGLATTRHARHRKKRDPRVAANRPKTRRAKN